MALPPLLGIEIGGTKLQLGIGPGDGTLLALERLSVDPDRRAAGILDQITAAFPPLLGQAGLAPHQIKAAGVGFGGPVDSARGRIQKSYQVEGWDDFPLAEWIRQHLQIPSVVIENDADTAGLAECRFGAGCGHSPVVYITVGSGIGGALIIDDRVYRGAGLGATEIGHLRVPVRHSRGRDIVWRELELVASGWAIAAAARDLAQQKLHRKQPDWPVLTRANADPTRITAAIVAQAAAAGDPDATTILAAARASFAFALTQVIALLAPRRIVIGGGVSLIGENDWFDPIRKLTDQQVFPPFRTRYDIVHAALGETVVVHGALAIARDALISRPTS
jgi:glucokinase